MPSFQLRAIFNAMIQNEDERRGVVDLVDKDLQASGYAEDQVFALLNDLLTAPNALQMNEGVQSTRRLRSPFTQNFESQMPPLQIGAGMDARQTAPPLMGAVQYNPRSAYGSAIPGQPEQAGAQPTGNSQYFARQGQPGAQGQGGHQSPIPDQNYAPSQRAAMPPLSPAALADAPTTRACRKARSPLQVDRPARASSHPIIPLNRRRCHHPRAILKIVSAKPMPQPWPLKRCTSPRALIKTATIQAFHRRDRKPPDRSAYPWVRRCAKPQVNRYSPVSQASPASLDWAHQACPIRPVCRPIMTAKICNLPQPPPKPYPKPRCSRRVWPISARP